MGNDVAPVRYTLSGMPTSAAPDRAPLTPVTDDLTRRGQVLAQRRVRHGIRHVNDVAELAGMDRKTVARAEAGLASVASTEALEAFFDRLDDERGIDSSVGNGDGRGPITFDVMGPRTEWHFTVSGPVEDADEVRRQVVELIRHMEPTSE